MIGVSPPLLWGSGLPHKAQQAAPQAPLYWQILFIMGVGTKGAHHTYMTKGITKGRQSHTTTAAGQSTIVRVPSNFLALVKVRYQEYCGTCFRYSVAIVLARAGLHLLPSPWLTVKAFKSRRANLLAVIAHLLAKKKRPLLGLLRNFARAAFGHSEKCHAVCHRAHSPGIRLPGVCVCVCNAAKSAVFFLSLL